MRSRVVVASALSLVLAALPSYGTPAQGTAAVLQTSCDKAPQLAPGNPVTGGGLQTVDFMSATVGVGLTASVSACASPRGQTTTVAWPVRLALSSDAGHTWAIEGSLQLPGSRPGTWPAPAGSPPTPTGGFAPPAMLAFSSPTVGWAEVNGVLSHTADGGMSWHRADLGRRSLPSPTLAEASSL